MTSGPAASPVRSMTGYSRLKKTIGAGDVTVILKSVNHRGLDLHFYTPEVLDAFEASLRGVLKRRLTRGHIEVRIVLEKPVAPANVHVNRELLQAYLHAFQELSREHRLSGAIDLNATLRVPGMLSEGAPAELDAALETGLVAVMEEACDQLNEARAREGDALASDILSHQQVIANAAARLGELRIDASRAIRTRLEERVAELTVKVDPQRLAQEVALLADRSDIAEEITRLNIHTSQLAALIEQGGEVGKKLDFLLQEMNRETNTMLSKTSGAGDAGVEITTLALTVKSAIEKIREQVLNLE